jgi:hypothetical protein
MGTLSCFLRHGGSAALCVYLTRPEVTNFQVSHSTRDHERMVGLSVHTTDLLSISGPTGFLERKTITNRMLKQPATLSHRTGSLRRTVDSTVDQEGRTEVPSWAPYRASSATEVAPRSVCTSPARRQGLTVVHFSAQLEPCLRHDNTLHTLNTP